MTNIKNYFHLVKFAHTIFALPFALIGFFLGVNNLNGAFTIRFFLLKLLLVLICMVTARSAAMGFNRYLDRHLDAANPRTAVREIPRGIITPGNCLKFVLINCAVFILATFFINKICFFLSPVALFVVLFYSYTKRFTSLCHMVLGLGLSLAPIGAFLAVTGQFSTLPILFSLTVIFWVSGFDIIYSMQDVDFDTSWKLFSIPAYFGKAVALRISSVFHLISAVCVITAGLMGHFGLLYWIGIAVFLGMLIFQHSIVKVNDLRKVNVAFMTANSIASLIFSVLAISDLFLR